MANLARQLRPASFRGVPFHVPSDEVGFGHRIVRHEYPDRDAPGHEDMGKAARTFNITAIVIGTDFMAQAAALEAALEKKGAATLIHPHLGEVQVIVLDVSRAHDNSAVGQVTFTITCEKYGPLAFPAAGIDTAAGLGIASGNLFSAALADFNARFVASGLPSFVVEDGIARANDFVSGLRGILSQGGLLKTIGGGLPLFDQLTSGMATQVVGLFQNIAAFAARPKKAVIGKSTPPSLSAKEVAGLMRGLGKAAQVTVRDSVPATTRNRSVRQNNALALDGLFRASAVAALGDVARHASYESREEAMEMRNLAASAIESHRADLGAAGYDESWKAEGAMLAALSRDISDRIGRLPRTVSVKTTAIRSSLELSNRIYGDDVSGIFARAEDIRTRNNVRHPAFVPPKKLEVLVNG